MASGRPHERLARAAAALLAAASLLGGAPAHATTPVFVPPPGLVLAAGEGDRDPAFADIDGDGDLDAFIGTRSGDTFFFENTGAQTDPVFATPSVNPFGLTDIGSSASPALADIDGDGDLDAFIGGSNGKTVFFENTGSASAPAFAAFSENPFGLTDVGAASAPAFADIDGDGDLDAFIGRGRDSLVYFENTGSASAPAFAAAAQDPFGLWSITDHSDPEFADIDGDGDLDAFIGNGDGDTFFFENTGSASAPAFAASSRNPFGLTGVNHSSHPAFADIDGDGDFDAFIGADYRGDPVFLENTGSAANPGFAASQDLFGAVDVGTFSTPTFADIDSDGDLDAFIGNVDGDTFFFENAGTSDAPAFAAPSLNPFGLTGVDGASTPSLADIDLDGDLDVFIGEDGGNTIFFENTGSSANPAFAAASQNPFGLANVGRYNTPTFADIDSDGDLDAFIGNGYGDTIFFENASFTPRAPSFGFPSLNPFGLVKVRCHGNPTWADIDDDGDLDAFIGDCYGDVSFFENTGSPAAPAFAAASPNPFGLLAVQGWSSPAFADIDGDGDLDAFSGDDLGRIFFFENRAPLDCPPAPGPCQDGFAKGLLMVSEKTPGKEKLVARLLKGPPLTQADFRDPLAGNAQYRLCLYGADDALAASLLVDRAGDTCGGKPCWKPIGKTPPDGKGFQYKDSDTAADGVKILKLKGGDAGKSALLVTATNNARKGQSALPTGISAALAGNASATVQLHASRDACFSVELGDVKKADVDLFKAKK